MNEPLEKYRLRKMARLAFNSKKVIDIGFSHYPNKYLQNSFVLGLDKESSICPENYSRCVVGCVEDLETILPNEKIDAVLAEEILKHLTNPMQFLEECYKLTATGGVLILFTPITNSFVEKILTLNQNRNYFYTKYHIMLFPQIWLIRMLEEAGYCKYKILFRGISNTQIQPHSISTSLVLSKHSCG